MPLKLLVTIFFLLLIMGCENNFNPIKENSQQYFSIYGVLDASADTQWVRVMPIRDSIFTNPEPLGATVTLTCKSTGEVFELNDSLFIPRDNVYVWNFWTTADIQPGEEYLFKAKTSEDEISSTEVIIPQDFPTPLVKYIPGNTIATINIKEVEILAAVRIYYYFRIILRTGMSRFDKRSFSHKEDIREVSDGLNVYAYPLNDIDIINQNNNNEFSSVLHERQEVMVISGGPAWPIYDELSEDEQYLPHVESNIMNGVGVLAGIVSKTVPLESCFEGEQQVPCPLLEPARPWN